MKVKCVAHLAYYMFAAVGVAAESTGDAMGLRLNALEESVSTLLGVVTKLSKDNDVLKEDNAVLEEDNDVLKEDNDVLKEDNDVLKGDNLVLRNELISMRSRRTTSTTDLERCFSLVGEGTKNKRLVVRCRTDFSRPALFKKPVKIANDVRIIKGNLMITNGGNSFDELNGKGNLVIGAKEVTQAGTHNIVLGDTHTFSSSGGLVLGRNNTISGKSSAVTGGENNIASGRYSAVSGGFGNEASGDDSTVTAGQYNIASNNGATVSGGTDNTANNGYGTVIGGKGWTTTFAWDVVGESRF